MNFFVYALFAFAGTGLAACAFGRNAIRASATGAVGVWLGCLLAAYPVAAALFGRTFETMPVAWNLPFGSVRIGLDALSAIFALPLLVLAPLAALFGISYLRGSKKPIGPAWFFFNLFVASMLLVLLARDGVLFIMAWEVMALSSFFLVIRNDTSAEVRAAGWIYLIATHLGAAFVFVFFIVLGNVGATTDLGCVAAFRAMSPATANALFVLATLGFGSKAGFFPMHVWLPEAHPAAPSHVSALMSGVMIKLGIYGIFRAATFFPFIAEWWCWTLIGIGVCSGIAGIISALAQHDLKRALAYSSVENVGIVVIGIGVGLLGIARSSGTLTALGFAAAFFHTVNHAIFKGLLFLAAGVVSHVAGTLDMNRLGGLLKRLPWTGGAFLVGAAAIAGLPPFNGFAGEFLLYLAGLKAAAGGDPRLAIAGMCIFASLPLIGGLAAACFAKCFAGIFLGEPRMPELAGVREPDRYMRIPLAILAFLCIALGLAAPLVVGRLALPPDAFAALGGDGPARADTSAIVALSWVVAVAASFVALTALLLYVRSRLLAGRTIAAGPTWDCGYAAPSPRMQYTPSSFVQPLAELFRPFLRTRERAALPTGHFPRTAAYATLPVDVAMRYFFDPLFRIVGWCIGHLRWLQHGQIHIYVLYVALTMVVLLVWKTGLP